MTEEDKKLLNTFDTKLRHFIYLHDKLEKENAALKAELEQKEKELTLLQENLQASELRYTTLQRARIISLHDKDIEDTKKRLSKLVREVDKCIALIKTK